MKNPGIAEKLRQAYEQRGEATSHLSESGEP